MKHYKLFSVLLILLFITGITAFTTFQKDNRFVAYTVNPKEKAVKLYWKDDKQQKFKSIGNLKQWLAANGKKLEFAMNGGMYTADNSPLGLYIEKGKTLFL